MEDGMMDLFLETVRRAKTKYDFTMETFTLMGNHFHFIVTPKGDESLSKIMQWILSVFAVKYNKIHGYVGHVWAARFASYIVSDIKDFLRTFGYIDENPVAAGLAAKAADWKYCALYHRLHGVADIVEPLPWLRDFFPKHAGC